MTASTTVGPYFLPAFVLDWLRFIADSKNVANINFKRFCQKFADWQLYPDQKLIRHFDE